MDVTLVPKLIRLGRDAMSDRGVRSAAKPVSPLSWFTTLSCAEVATRLADHFAREFHTHASSLSDDELVLGRDLVESKYSTRAWINRLP